MDHAELELALEEDVLNNPYSYKSWYRYLDFKKDASPKERNKIYERALRSIPGSYKLWLHYLQERVDVVKKKEKYCFHSEEFYKKYKVSLLISRSLSRSLSLSLALSLLSLLFFSLSLLFPYTEFPSQSACENVNRAFERSLVFMHKMPKMWAQYCSFLCRQRPLTRTRRAFDRALRSLPLTQHDSIWGLYLPFARQCGVPSTTVRVFRRYLQLEPGQLEDFLEYLQEVGYVREAAELLLQVCGDPDFVSTRDKSRLELWLELCQLISQHPAAMQNVDADAVIRFGIRKFTDCVGRMWTALAEYYIRLKQFEKARDVFEEAMNTVKTVQDFSLIWEVYTVFLEGLLNDKTKNLDEIALDEDRNVDLDLILLRYESLIERRPLLLSSVLLRQNPHNVVEWERRAQIYSDPKEVKKKLEVYSEAIATVDPTIATGKPHRLWIGYAIVYEKAGRMDYARQILQQVGVLLRREQKGDGRENERGRDPKNFFIYPICIPSTPFVLYILHLYSIHPICVVYTPSVLHPPHLCYICPVCIPLTTFVWVFIFFQEQFDHSHTPNNTNERSSSRDSDRTDLFCEW